MGMGPVTPPSPLTLTYKQVELNPKYLPSLTTSTLYDIPKNKVNKREIKYIVRYRLLLCREA